MLAPVAKGGLKRPSKPPRIGDFCPSPRRQKALGTVGVWSGGGVLLLDAAVILTVARVTGETVSQCDELAAKGMRILGGSTSEVNSAVLTQTSEPGLLEGLAGLDWGADRRDLAERVGHRVFHTPAPPDDQLVLPLVLGDRGRDHGER
jgi:hypothetical protein